MRPRHAATTVALLTAIAGCATSSGTTVTTAPEPGVSPADTTGVTTLLAPAAPAAGVDNPLIAEWSGPYGGVPALDRVEVRHFRPALEAGMAAYMADVERIAGNPEPPTFQNTIVAMERAGALLNRTLPIFNIWSSTMNSAEFQAVEREMAPQLAAFNDRISQNEALFRRIEAVYEGPEMDTLNAEQQRLAWYHHNNFVRSGARLGAAQKSRLSEINQELAGLFTRFNQNVLADESGLHVVVRDATRLAGLSQQVRDAQAAEATSRGLAGSWVVSNTRSSVEPVLMYADDRELRREVFEMFASRGDRGDEHDNNAIAARILRLRAERARLLGYETHAHFRLENAMASEPERAVELMEALWAPAVARVAEEVADMQSLADSEGAGITIEAWDYRYYAEKVRSARYDLDQDEVRQYLQLDLLRDGMFRVATELFGMEFRQVDVPVQHESVSVWEVTDRGTGAHRGLFYFDPFARAGKRSGAWMNAYRPQHRVDGDVSTIVSNNSNFVPGAPGEPVLVSWIDATTLFHEFGHAIHGLLSDVTYPSLSGTRVARDYVEFPSQLLEHWLATEPVLQQYALHHEAGTPIPSELVDRIARAATFNTGFNTVEQLSAAIVDMRLHLAGDTALDMREFERETLADLGMPREIIMRHRIPHFLHVFGSDGYSAGYYSYSWSDVLTADAYEAFMEATGLYDAAVAARLREHILSPGNTVDPAGAYRAFRGRDASVDALLRKRGFQ